ncbi:MAG: nucleotidyltransferase family protein [Candidatus Micrarchaeia archaeon]
MAPTIAELKEKILPILLKHSVRKAGIFGSAARGEMKKKSDVDLLVELDDGVSLLGMAEIKIELEEKLGRKVDLVEYAMIKPRVRDRILAEEVSVI